MRVIDLVNDREVRNNLLQISYSARKSLAGAHFQKMPNCREIKREVKLVNTIQSVSARINVGATSGGDGGAMDWKKKYEEELDKRSTIEEQNDDLQTQVCNCKSD